MSYALMNMGFAKILGLQPGELTYFGWDAHLYDNQIETVKQQIQRTPKELPQLKFKKDFSTLNEFLELQYEDIELIDYNPHPAFPKIDMAV
jgi:thymidylate synthase